MHENYHVQITKEAVRNSFSDRALAIIIEANLNQDSLLNLLKGHYHFDANGFDQSFVYIDHQRRIILDKIQRGDALEAWRAFGRLTHVVQDFYAHTNYVALWQESFPDEDFRSGEGVPPLLPQLLGSDRLFAARVYYPLEALSIFPIFNPFLKRILPSDAHVNMNLDSPESGPLFPLAMSAAINRTRVTFQEICSAIESTGDETRLMAFLDRAPA